MNDNETRFRILKYLKMAYNKEPSAFANRAILLDECQIPDSDLEGNLKHLKNAGLVDMQMRLGGDFIVKINNNGIDAVNQMEKKLQKDDEFREDVISHLMGETKVYVDLKLQRLDPNILTRLNFIYEDLTAEHHEHGFARVAYDCRELLLDFSDAVFQEYPEYTSNIKAPLKRDQAKIKLEYVLKGFGEFDEHGKLLSAKLDYILNYLGVLNDFQEKSGSKKISFSLEDAKSCLIYTYLFMRDVLKLIDRFKRI